MKIEQVFMDGINLLSQSEIIDSHVGYIVFSMFTMLISGFLAIMFAKINVKTVAGFFIITCVMSLISIIVLLLNPTPTGDYNYKVTISDEVNFNNFNEQYKIVSQDGKIYTIQKSGR